MPTLRQLRYFVEIVDAGSFSLAAERLHVAQSALSRQLKEMEAELQVPLLDREARPLALTPAGRSLDTDARRILASLGEATARARHAQQGIEGTLRLLHSSSVPPGAALLGLLRRFTAEHPGVAVEIAQASSEQQAREIAQGRADLGLARAPVLRREPGIAYAALCEEPLVALLPPGHRLAAPAGAGLDASALPLDALRDEPFVAIAHPERGGLGRRVAELCRAQGFEPRAAAVRSRKWTQLALVQAGFGVAVVPRGMAEAAPVDVGVRALGDACRTQVLALRRPDAPALVARFAAALGEAFAAPAPI